MYLLLVATLISCCSFEVAYCKPRKAKLKPVPATAQPIQESVPSTAPSTPSAPNTCPAQAFARTGQNVVVFPMAIEQNKTYLLLMRPKNKAGLGLPGFAAQKHHGYDPQENYLATVDDLLHNFSADMMSIKMSTEGLMVEPKRHAHFVIATYSAPEALAEATADKYDFIWVPVDEFLSLISGKTKSIKSKDGKQSIGVQAVSGQQHLGEDLQKLVANPGVVTALYKANKLS